MKGRASLGGRHGGSNARRLPTKQFALLREVVSDILSQSTAPEAKTFDADAWLRAWLETEQPGLAGRRPADLMSTTDGMKAVERLLGSVLSGSYQ